LTTGSYGIITGADNTVAAVFRGATFSFFLEWLDWQREHITDTALSPDNARCTRIDLQFAPQPQDLDIDAPIENFFVNSVGSLQQMLPRERPLRCLEKCEQQRILTVAQRDWRRIGIEESPATAFQLPAVESVPTSLRVMGTGNAPNFLAPQYGTDAGKQLSEAEWLYDIVIRSEFEADDAIDFVGTMAGRDDDGNL
jgi:hypothetical protein